MGQAAAGVMQGPGNMPMGYQPSEGASVQAMMSKPSKFVDDDYWGRQTPDASSRHGGNGAMGSYQPSPPPELPQHQLHNERLASFNTDVDAACDRADRADADYRAGGGIGVGGVGTGIGHGFDPGFSIGMGAGFDKGFDQGSRAGSRAGSKDFPYPAAPSTPSAFNSGTLAVAGDFNGSGSTATRSMLGQGSSMSYSSGGAPGARPLASSSAFSSHSSSMGAGMNEKLPTRREEWDVGSVVEVYSATVGRWYPARIMSVEPRDGKEVLTVQFLGDDGLKMKAMHRDDVALELFGVHISHELPPGFQRRPSQSRPGQMVFFDATTGMKYASGELAWRVHLERLINQPAVGMQTVGAVPGTGVVASSPCASAASSAVAPMPTHLQAAPPPPSPNAYSPQVVSLADLHAQGQRLGGGGGCIGLDPVIEDEPVDGKVALPSFGDGRNSSQATYLGYMNTPGCAGGSNDDQDAAYRTPTGARVPAAQRPTPVRVVNPAIAAWQDDPFSQWRR